LTVSTVTWTDAVAGVADESPAKAAV